MRIINLLAVLCLATACAVHADEKPPKMPEPQPPGEVRPSTQPNIEAPFVVKFVRVPWPELFAWYEKKTGLKADVKVEADGSLTLAPGRNRAYTTAEFTDIINEALVQQKLLLIPHHKSFAIVSIDEKINPKLVPTVEIKDLPKLPRTALVETMVPLPPELAADDISDELKKLLTPLGEILYAKGKWLIVRDTAGNLRQILKVLEVLRNAQS